MFVYQDTISRVRLDVGDDGFMLGLFSGQTGKTKNLVAARFGNISLLADEAEPIRQGNGICSPCHVFDMHSRPGFSGSPVFIYRTPDGDLRDLERRTHGFRVPPNNLRLKRSPDGEEIELIDTTDENNRFLRLLGIHVGQFHEAVKIHKVVPKRKLRKESDNTLRDGDEIRFPGSMTIIVPAWQIAKLLNEDDKLMQQRGTRDAAAKAAIDTQRTAVVPEKVTQAEPEDANPDHKGDFSRLLNAAVKKPKSGD